MEHVGNIARQTKDLQAVYRVLFCSDRVCCIISAG
jgi:hypothetical protein